MISPAAAMLADWLVSPQSIPLGWLILILPAIVAVAITYLLRSPHGSANDRRWRQAGLLSLRLLSISCVLLMLIHPVRTQEVSRLERPAIAILLDDSRSMALPAWSHQATGRYDLARRLAQAAERHLSDRFDLLFYDVQGRPLANNDLPDRPAQSQSPLSLAISRIADDLADRPASALLIFSDGRETPGDPDSLPPHAWVNRPIPAIFTIDFADQLPDRPSAFSITSVTAPAQAMLGGQVNVTVDMQSPSIGKTNPPSEPTHQLTIHQGSTLLAVQTFHWPSDQSHHRQTIRFTAKQAGELALTLQVKSLNDSAASLRWPLAMKVRAKPLTVLYVDGVVRWEGKFLRQALSSDRHLQLISKVRSAPVNSAAPNPQPIFSDSSLESVDVVILGDVDASQLSLSEIAALRRWVTKQGGGLAVTGGYRSFGPGGLGQSGLAAILPIDFCGDEHPQIEQPFTLGLTAAGQQSPIFHLSGLPERDTAFYQSLPMLEGCCRIAGIKPAAQVLAINPLANGPDGQPGLPVMVSQPVGLGRTLVLTADTTWRWRMVVTGFTGDSTFYERFWGQIVRALAGDASANASESNRILVNTTAGTYRLNETAMLMLTAAPQMDLSAMAIDDSGRSQELILNRTSDGHHQANLPTHLAGNWHLLLTAKPAGQPTRPQTPIVQKTIRWRVLPEDVESVDPQPDPNRLEQLAQSHGGQRLSVSGGQDVTIFLDRLESLVQPLAKKPAVRSESEFRELWRHPLLVGLLLSCLCVEWVWRRQGRWL